MPTAPRLNKTEENEHSHVTDRGGGIKYSWSDINEFVDYLQHGHQDMVDKLSIMLIYYGIDNTTVHSTQSLNVENVNEEEQQ
jgi:hypothetical protein